MRKMSKKFPKVKCEDCRLSYEACHGSFKKGSCRCSVWKGKFLKSKLPRRCRFFKPLPFSFWHKLFGTTPRKFEEHKKLELLEKAYKQGRKSKKEYEERKEELEEKIKRLEKVRGKTVV